MERSFLQRAPEGSLEVALVVQARLGISRLWGARQMCIAKISHRGFRLHFDTCQPLKNGLKISVDVPYDTFYPGTKGHLSLRGEVKWYDLKTQSAGGVWNFSQNYESITLNILLDPLVCTAKKEENEGAVEEIPLRNAS
jgi:hypothetical protein